MSSKRVIHLKNTPSIISFGSVVSKKEAEGPLSSCFDIISEDSSFGEKTWEKSESRMQKDAINKALGKGLLTPNDIDLVFAGDLLNQCIGSTFGLRELQIPFVGIYGACSNFTESIALGAIFADSGSCDYTAAVTSSHFCSAERQYRYPLEYGGQRTATSQWTVTGAGAAIIGKKAAAPFIRSVMFGTIEDLGIKDPNNMGAAMAPAAAKTISGFLTETNTQPCDYDLILTGDLGATGRELLFKLMEEENFDITKQHNDCGLLIYDRDRQDVDAGGSGCGCCAVVSCGYILPKIVSGEYKNVLIIATGALLSPTSTQQGESIPAVAHLIHLSNTVC